MKTLKFIFATISIMSLALAGYVYWGHPLFLCQHLVIGYPEIIIYLLVTISGTIGAWICNAWHLLDGRNWLDDRLNEETTIILSKQQSIKELQEQLNILGKAHDKCVDKIKQYEKDYYNTSVTIKNNESIIEKLTKERDALKFTTEEQAMAIKAKDNKIEELTTKIPLIMPMTQLSKDFISHMGIKLKKKSTKKKKK